MQTVLFSILIVYLALVVTAFRPVAPTVQNSRSLSPLLGSAHGGDSSSSKNLLEFLADSQKLGYVRFVVVGTGAILEAVGTFDNLRISESSKGKLATVSLEEPCFECHIRLDEIQIIKSVMVNKFDKELRILRFIDSDKKTVLSAILHEESDVSIQAWETIREKYGETFTVPRS